MQSKLEVDKSKSNRGHLKNVHYLRGIAAVSILFHHLWIELEYYLGVNSEILNSISDVSRSSIELFFVLSGFIMVYTNYHKVGLSNILSFLKKRIIRIYVPYIPLAIVLYLAYKLFPELSNNIRSIDFLTNFFLIPHGTPALSVAWTLIFEIAFYFIFILWFSGKNVWKTITFFWFFSIVIIHSINPQFLINSHEWHIFSSYNLCFILGTWGGMYFNNLRLSLIGYISFIIISILLLVLAFTINIQLIKHLFLGISFSMLIVSLGEIQAVKSKNIRVFGFLGTISYSLYLVHNPLIAFFMRLNNKFELNLPLFLSLITTIMVVCVAYVYYLIFEKKTTKLFKQLIN